MKKSISLFLVVSIISLSIPLTAKEKKGADLIVKKTDGTQVRGELIAVKQTSLLLLERESGADVTVDIGEVSVIIIVKKSKLLLGAGLGTLIGAGFGAGGAASMGDTRYEQEVQAAMGMIWGALVGLLIGTIFGLTAGTDKTIQIEGRSDAEIREILEYLRKKARVKNAL